MSKFTAHSLFYTQLNDCSQLSANYSLHHQELSVHSKFERVLGQLQNHRTALNADGSKVPMAGQRQAGHMRSSV